MFGVRLVIALVALAITAGASPTLAATCAIGQPGCCAADPDCDDGDPCNGAESCEVVTGTCLPGLPVDGIACNDGNACTVGDTCQAGVCTGTAVVCSPSDQCHAAGTCDPATGMCSDPAQLDGTPCDDGNACTQTDACAAGVCMGGNPVVCTAADQCHDAGVCNPATGVCSSPAKLNGAPCDDGNACTQTDACQTGICTGTNPVVCTAADQCHTTGVCNPATGVCGNPAKPDGSACDDGNACTQTDACQTGVCTGANPVLCTALDTCHVTGTCDPGTGTCSNPVRADGTSCDDGDACTVGDRCVAGTCAGVPRSCDDGIACTDDSCVGGACQHAPLDSRCDSGLCFLAQCSPGTPGADAAGCTKVPVGEGDACTSDDLACTEDVCMAGACRHLAIDGRCATGEACLPAVCDPANAAADATGCVAVPERVNGMECAEDGDPCTDDACMAGACAHAPVPNKPACDPVRPVYERALALAADARDLTALVTGALTPTTPGTSGSPGDSLVASVDHVASRLDGVTRILAGRSAALAAAVSPTGSSGATPAPGFPNVAKERAGLSLAQLKDTPAEEQRIVHDLALAQRRGLMAAGTARDLRRRGRGLLSRTKGLKRGLRRLKRVSQSFTR